MIKPDTYIKHPKFVDVAFYVLRVTPLSGFKQYLDVYGEWINLGQIESFAIGQPEALLLPVSKWNEWEVCLTPNLACLRYATWHPQNYP